MLRRQRKVNKMQIKQNKRRRKAAVKVVAPVPKISKMAGTLRNMKKLAVSPEIGKFDLWAGN